MLYYQNGACTYLKCIMELKRGNPGGVAGMVRRSKRNPNRMYPRNDLNDKRMW